MQIGPRSARQSIDTLSTVSSASGYSRMSQNNLLQAYNWENQFEDSQIQFPRPISDEVISIYEVYVKEENPNSTMKNSVTVLPSLPSNDQQLMQGDCVDLGASMNSDLENIDPNTGKFSTKDSMKYKILEQSVGAPDDNVVMYSHPISEGAPSTTRLIDKDDPRSRLHFVKYLKRDGKTLKIWECGICSKEFRHQYTLMRHLPTHTDERNFKCEACGKAFRQLSTLSQHKAIHSDARPYVCEFCKKTFNRVSTLISHRKTHSEHKPHKCQICGKGFHQKGNLRNHVFTHTNERPYKCELCGKGFNQMSNLVCHKVKAHAHAEKMQYVCGICGKEFPRRFSLRSHEEFKHGIKYRQPTNHQNTINDPSVIRNKSVRIVQLPSADRNQVVEVKDKDPLVTSDYVESVVIDKIETKAMEMALLEGQTPFALFKPAKGIPILVKVSPTGAHKHVLTPATPEDLRRAGKISVTPPVITSEADGSKTFQVKVPVVATVIQNIEEDGKVSFIVEAPGPDNEQESLVTALDSQFTYGDQQQQQPGRNEPDRQDVSAALSPPMEACNELLELAAQGGIQFVRATEDGRYEVMSNNEARELMAQNSHDVTILDGEEADAINVVNIRGNGDMIIGDQDNQIMVLDSNSPQKTISMDGIEILEDKDIRILESKSLDERFSDGILFSQSKLDDLILGQKALGIDDSVSGSEHDSQVHLSMGLPVSPSQQELANLLGHRSDMSALCSNSNLLPQASMSSLLLKNHTPLSMLNETLPYLKSSSSLVDDFGLLAAAGIDDHHLQYESKMKLPPVFDDPETDGGLMSINSPDLKLLGSTNQTMKFTDYHEGGVYGKLASSKSCQQPSSKFFPSFGDMKLLEGKSTSQDLMASEQAQYQDMKLFSPYEQFLKNMATNTNGCETSSNTEYRKDLRIMGKKLNVLGENDSSNMEIVEEKVKTEFFYATCYSHPHITALEHQQRAFTNYCNYHTSMVMNGGVDFCTAASVDGTMLTSPRLSRQIPESSGPDNYLLQTCSPCDTDFLSFEARLKDSSPSGHFDRVHKECRDAFNNPTGLPDLD